MIYKHFLRNYQSKQSKRLIPEQNKMSTLLRARSQLTPLIHSTKT